MRVLKLVLRIVATLLLVLLIAVSAGWGVLALYYSGPPSDVLRTSLAVLFGLLGLATLTGLALRRWRRRALGIWLVVFTALVAWWSSIAPSNDRDWKPEVAVLPYATLEGDQVTVHNIRNFDYRSETDFTPRYYDKTFDLRQLDSVDLIASYWAGPAIAHIFLSFGFGENDHLAVSIERRDERGEGYSTIKGLFKQFELFYVVADERDVIRVRTNYRRDPPEDVYVFRLQGPSAERAARVSRIHGRDQFAEGATRVLQHADDQLHRQHLAALARQSRACAVFLEDPAQRSRPGVSVWARQARYQPVIPRAHAPQPSQ